jgi:hypothetical protein
MNLLAFLFHKVLELQNSHSYELAVKIPGAP